MNPVNITEGSGQIILAQPHGGTFFPPVDDVQNEIIPTLNEIGRELADTALQIVILLGTRFIQDRIRLSFAQLLILKADQFTKNEPIIV